MTPHKPLAEKRHWTGVHRTTKLRFERRALVYKYAPKLLGKRWFEFFYYGGYPGQVVHEQVLGPHLRRGMRMLEIGSAPGVDLAKLALRFGCDPWGLEYTEAGAVHNRATFEHFGLPADHVIQADFFSPEVLEVYGGTFDVVISNGFIEHFTDVRSVIARHVALLAPGGLLSVSIPNLAGVNKRLGSYFNADVLAKHNLEIMSLDAFGDLFTDQGLSTLSCGYVGVFSISLQNTPPGSYKRHLLRIGNLLQKPLDMISSRVYRDHCPQVPWASPYLHFVGRRDVERATHPR